MSISKRFSKFILKSAGGSGIGRYVPFVNKIEDFLFSHAVESEFVLVDTLAGKMYLDMKDVGISRDLYKTGWHELGTTNLLSNVVKEGMTALDIGAHIGYFTLILSKLVGERGRVISFEPEPRNFSLLRRNIKLNSCLNVTAVQKAVTNENGRVRLFLHPRGTGDHSIHPVHFEAQRSLEVETVRLDSYLSRNGILVNFVKIDVQGAEPLVIEGFQSTLEESKPLIVMEYSPDLWPISRNVLGKLSEIGYEFYLIGQKQGIKPVKIYEIEGLWLSRKKIYFNIFLRHPSGSCGSPLNSNTYETKRSQLEHLEMLYKKQDCTMVLKRHAVAYSYGLWKNCLAYWKVADLRIDRST